MNYVLPRIWAAALVASAFVAGAAQNMSEQAALGDPQLFKHLSEQLGHLRSLRWVGGMDTFLGMHIAAIFRELQSQRDAKNYNESDVADAIDSLAKLSNDKMVSASDAAVLRKDAELLRHYRENHAQLLK